jgi:hypothetical protein
MKSGVWKRASSSAAHRMGFYFLSIVPSQHFSFSYVRAFYYLHLSPARRHSWGGQKGMDGWGMHMVRFPSRLLFYFLSLSFAVIILADLWGFFLVIRTGGFFSSLWRVRWGLYIEGRGGEFFWE